MFGRDDLLMESSGFEDRLWKEIVTIIKRKRRRRRGRRIDCWVLVMRFAVFAARRCRTACRDGQTLCKLETLCWI